MNKSGSYALLFVSAAAVAATGFLLFSYAFRRGEAYAEGSSYRATGEGLRALALLVEAQGHPVSRLADPWMLKEKRGLLVTSGSSLEPNDLKSWVARGNTALLLCEGPNAHLETLGIRMESRAGGSMTALLDAPFTQGAPRLELASNYRFVPGDLPDSWTPLYADGDEVGALVVEAGSGRYVLVSDRHLATNLGLPDADHAVFLVNVAESARGGEIVFDEISTRLGLDEPGLMAYARKAGVQALFLEAGLLALLAFWHFGSRIGPPVGRRRREPPAVPDYVTGRARLYEKASMERTAAAALAETLRDALRRSARLSPAAAEEGRQLLGRAEALGKERRRKTHELVGLARSIHDYLNEALWKPSRRAPRATRTAPWKRK